jgi:hypothetical protein
MPRELFIVARHDHDLYDYLKRRFTGRADVEVIYDRRVGERRRRNESPAHDRRGADRRSRTTLDEDLELLGFAVLPADPDGSR